VFRSDLTIINKTGLHARPAAELALMCRQFNCELRVINGNAVINPKNIISILAGRVKQGDSVVLEAEGSDEEEAGNAIAGFIKNLKD